MSPDSLDRRFADAMGQLLGPDFPKDIALAVSGGGDSMAMLALAHNWARVWGVRLWIVTVDHGLRAESASEAEMVARETATLGWQHATLRWTWDGAGNVQDAARRARLSLIDRWRAGLDHVLMAHTCDDVAETFLMRLARGSGVDGLAAMAARRRVPSEKAGLPGLSADEVRQSAPPPIPTHRVTGVPAYSPSFEILRPCLEMSRADLRHYARSLHMPWVDDPSNDDPKYDRARARRLLAELKTLDLTVPDLVATAQRMRRASEALQARAVSVARQILREDRRGVLVFDREGFEAVERDTQLRLLAAGCMWISGAEYRPRAQALEGLLDRLLGGGAGTLSGSKAQTGRDTVMVYREVSAVENLRTQYRVQQQVWDGRWRITGTSLGEIYDVAALGKGIIDCPDWRNTGLPRAALMASPAIWQGDTLIAAPLTGFGADWYAHIATSFETYLLSH